MTTLLWTQAWPGLNVCTLDGVRYRLEHVTSGRYSGRFQVVVDEQYCSDFFVSEVEAAIWADGFAEAEGTTLDRYRAGHDALQRWTWMGRTWQAPATQPIETLD